MTEKKDRKELYLEALRRQPGNRILIDPTGIEVAIMVANDYDFYWICGNLKPLEGFEKYRPLFEQAAYLDRQAEVASDEGRDEDEEKYNEQKFEIFEQISAMDFKIRSALTGEDTDWSVLNICGLEFEYR